MLYCMSLAGSHIIFEGTELVLTDQVDLLIYYLFNRIILIYICILHIYLRMRLFIVC